MATPTAVAPPDDDSQTVDHALARGFAQHPDSDDDVRRTTTLAINSIAHEPWEKWW